MKILIIGDFSRSLIDHLSLFDNIEIVKDITIKREELKSDYYEFPKKSPNSYSEVTKRNKFFNKKGKS